MIKSAPYYWVVCDGCGVPAQEDHDYAAWADQSDALDVVADRDGWWSPDPGNSHYCPSCARIRQSETGAVHPAEQPPGWTSPSSTWRDPDCIECAPCCESRDVTERVRALARLIATMRSTRQARKDADGTAATGESP